MKSTTAISQLLANLPAEFQESFDVESPWNLLGEPLNSVLGLLPSEKIDCPLDPRMLLSGDQIVIGSGSRIHPGATIEGPIRIGSNTEVGPGAVLRGGNWIGDSCYIGANTDIRRSIFLRGASAPGVNFIALSILGVSAEVGAGTVLCNRDPKTIEENYLTNVADVPLDRDSVGAILGDRVVTGCNCVLERGVLVSRSSQIPSGTHLSSGSYPNA